MNIMVAAPSMARPADLDLCRSRCHNGRWGTEVMSRPVNIDDDVFRVAGPAHIASTGGRTTTLYSASGLTTVSGRGGVVEMSHFTTKGLIAFGTHTRRPATGFAGAHPRKDS